MLLPALAKAKAKAHAISCVNNLKQLAIISELYAGDNNERIASNGQGDSGAGPTWVAGSFESTPLDNTNWFLLTDPKHSLFGPYLKTTQVYRCPADRSTVLVNGRKQPVVRSYGMNAQVAWEGTPYRENPSSAHRLYKKTTDVTDPSPSELFVFAEIHPESICRPFFGLHLTRPSFYHVPGNYHGKSATISFADSHVESHRWLNPRTYDPPKSLDWHGHDYSSPNNPDLLWIQQHATAKR
jgi:prepilin-type processing-associated H-X9-DG protein